jgi:hypothetical protein
LHSWYKGCVFLHLGRGTRDAESHGSTLDTVTDTTAEHTDTGPNDHPDEYAVWGSWDADTDTDTDNDASSQCIL